VCISNRADRSQVKSGVIGLAVLLVAASIGQCWGASTGTAASPSSSTLDFVGSPTVAVIGDWTFLNVTGHNAWSLSLDVVMFAVWKTIESGTAVAVETGGASVAAGETANFYVPAYNIIAGTYIVTVFGVGVENNAPVTLALQFQTTLT